MAIVGLFYVYLIIQGIFGFKFAKRMRDYADFVSLNWLQAINNGNWVRSITVIIMLWRILFNLLLYNMTSAAGFN